MHGLTTTNLRAFRQPMRAAVIGGIGRALTEALAGCDGVAGVVACSRSPNVPEHPKVVRQPIDLQD